MMQSNLHWLPAATLFAQAGHDLCGLAPAVRAIVRLLSVLGSSARASSVLTNSASLRHSATSAVDQDQLQQLKNHDWQQLLLQQQNQTPGLRQFRAWSLQLQHQQQHQHLLDRPVSSSNSITRPNNSAAAHLDTDRSMQTSIRWPVATAKCHSKRHSRLLIPCPQSTQLEHSGLARQLLQQVRHISSHNARRSSTHKSKKGTRKQVYVASSGDNSHVMAELHDQLVAATPERVVTAVMSNANSWPSLSRDPTELIHRIRKLEELVGSAAAAHDMIISHPQLLTRPPAALEQQVLNLAEWLRVPLLQQQAQQQPGSQGQSKDQFQPDSHTLQVCQDLMQFIRSNPGCLSLSKEDVMDQLAAVHSLLPLLPPLESLLEDQIAAFEQLLAEAKAQQNWQQQQGAAQQQHEVAELEAELQHWLQQRQQQTQQMMATFAAWRRSAMKKQHQPQLQQQPQTGSSTQHAANSSWAWQLVQQEPEWLFIDTERTLPRKIEYLTRSLFAGSPAPGRCVADLLLSAPQVINVTAAHMPAKLRVLQEIMLQHPAVKASTDYTHWLTNPQQELVIPTLLQAPLLLLQSAKELQERSSRLNSLLPLLPLHHTLDLLQQQDLQWQHLNFLQHVGLLPAQAPAQDSNSAQQLAQQQQQQQQLPWQQSHEAVDKCAGWGYEDYITAADAVKSSAHAFGAKYPEFLPWRALLTVVEGQPFRGWDSEFRSELIGQRFQVWLSAMRGNWHRLLMMTAGQPWVTARNSSGSTNSSSTAGISFAQLQLQQLPELRADSFPYRPAELVGPLPFDLPEQQQMQLLTGSKADLDSILAAMSETWQKLAAATAVNPTWQQQLGCVLTALPEALAAAGWGIPAADVAATEPLSSTTSSDASSDETCSWVDDIIAGRVTEQQMAAATARQQFWQHIQRPGVLDDLISRLEYLHLLQPASTTSAAADPPASSLWPILAARDEAFAAQYPEFSAYMQLRRLTNAAASWRDELQSWQGAELSGMLQQAQTVWNRLQYLTSGSSSGNSSSSSIDGNSSDGHGGLWRAICLRDAISTSDKQFEEMFPDYRYASWQTLAAIQQDASCVDDAAAAAAGLGGGSSGTAAASSSEQGPGSSAKSTHAAQHLNKGQAAKAAQRLQLLQQYAVLRPEWAAELSTWPQAYWTAAAKSFTAVKAKRVEFALQLVDPTDETSGTAAGVEEPSLHILLSTNTPWYNKRFPEFKTWTEVSDAVQAVPKWAADWQAIKGQQLRQVLQTINELQTVDLGQAYQQAYEARMQVLQSSVEQSSNSHQQCVMDHIALQAALKGRVDAGSRSSNKNDPFSWMLSAALASANAKAGANARTKQQQQQQGDNMLSGCGLALQRLSYFSKSHKSIMQSLSLSEILTAPQMHLAWRFKGLDVNLDAAKQQGVTAAESEVLKQACSWLGPEAVRPEVLAGLSPEAQQHLRARPQDLLVLQQLAHTWPDWEAQLHTLSSEGLYKCLKRVRTRAQRLQVLARAKIQKYNSLRSVLLMDESKWRERYPIAWQLAEVLSAAQGVAAWERTLSTQPEGRDLVAQIGKMHARRGRLSYLRHEGCVEPSHNVLNLLRCNQDSFIAMYPSYPGDAVLVDRS